MTEIKSPFKFLDYYDSDDIQIFFGREDEEKVIYQLVKKNRFVLVYGPSGSGKTSLVQCGLARQFEPHEWIPIYVRRGNNINASLINELKQKFQLRISPQAQLNERTQLKFIFDTIRKVDLRPIYLIFDQFEELLILGNQRELDSFKTLLRDIIEQHSVYSCNVILLLQEEYFAWLDSFEKDLRGISDNRLRVEPMRTDDVKDVIKKSCDHFRIAIENPEKDIAHIIDVLSGKHSVSLPYLQVYLDQLWKHARKKQGVGPRTNGSDPVQFTSTDIRIFGNFKDVLFRFLKQQAEELQQELSAQFKGIEEDCVANSLDCFATIEGTKLPIPYTFNQGIYTLDVKAPQYLRNLKPQVLKHIIDKLLESRILRADGSNIELAHDTLSRLIDSQRNSIRRRENEIRMDVQKGLEEWKKDPKEFLSYKKVKEYESFIPAIKLEKEQLDFYNRSKEFREDEELEKLKRVKKFNRLKFLISLLIFLLFVVLIIGNYLVNEANSDFALVKMAYTIDTIKNKRLALQLAKHIYDFKEYDQSVDNNLRIKITRIALEQEIQKSFGKQIVASDTKKAFPRGEVGISQNGEFLFIKDADSTIRIFDKFGSIDTLARANYAYFLNDPDILLLANNSQKYTEAPNELRNLSNSFILYDCRKRMIIDSVDLSNAYGYLHSISTVFAEDERSDYSFRVMRISGGALIIPILQYRPRGPISNPFVKKKIMFKDSGVILNLLELSESIHPPSYSDKKKGFIILKGDYSEATMNYLTPSGTSIKAFENVRFGDFTEKGNFIYISGKQVIIRDGNVATVTQINDSIEAAYANGDELHIVATTEYGQIYIADRKTGKLDKYEGDLVGVDFKTKKLIYRNARTERDFILLSFYGNPIDTFSCPEEIDSYTYNRDSSTLMILTKKNDLTTYQHLYALDRNLKIRASFGLTPNDSYGISGDGSTFYYLRDNYLTVFKNNDSLVNLTRFADLNAWMNKNIACEVIGKDTLNTYRLVFPKQKIERFFGLGIRQTCPTDK